jgi:alanine racemase
MINKLLVNKSDLLYNTNYIASIQPNCKIIAVVKDNAYGHGSQVAVEILNTNENVTSFGVADFHEYTKIKNSTNKPVLIFKRLDIKLLNELENDNLDIQITVDNLDYLIKNYDLIKKYQWQLKINTGMNRNGIDPDQIDELIIFLKENNISKIKGIFSHLYNSSPKSNETVDIQINIFKKVLKKLKDFTDFEQIHMLAGGGSLSVNDDIFTHIRPGLALFGLSPFEVPYPQLKQVGKIQSYVSQLRDVKFGSVGYGNNIDELIGQKIAVIPIGYGFGLSRSFKNDFVVINGKQFPIVGNICTDYLFAKVDNEVKMNDQVELFTNYDNKVNVITNYEAFTLLNDRLLRVIDED